MGNKRRRSRARRGKARAYASASLALAVEQEREAPAVTSEYAGAMRRGDAAGDQASVGRDSADSSVPYVGDLDARFFESLPSEAWLAHELELRDPRVVRKMTARVVRRRAHLVRYVIGVVGIAAAVAVAALVKSVVVQGDEPDPAANRPASPMTDGVRGPPLRSPPGPVEKVFGTTAGPGEN
jgi:hypothetical protein